MSIDRGLELFAYFSALPGQPYICSACGRAGKSGSASPSVEEVRTQLEKLPDWTAGQINQEIARLTALGIRLCDDCWQLGYFWKPEEAERLHKLAYRRRNMTRAEFDRKVANGSAIHERRQQTAKPAELEKWRFITWKLRPISYLHLLGEIFYLNNPEQLS